MLFTVVVEFPTPPVIVALFWSLSNFTVNNCLTLVTAPPALYSNPRLLLTMDGLAKRLIL